MEKDEFYELGKEKKSSFGFLIYNIVDMLYSFCYGGDFYEEWKEV